MQQRYGSLLSNAFLAGKSNDWLARASDLDGSVPVEIYISIVPVYVCNRFCHFTSSYPIAYYSQDNIASTERQPKMDSPHSYYQK